MAAYYIQLSDAYDIWDSLSEYSWRGLYQAIIDMRGGRSHLDDSLLQNLEYVMKDYQGSSEKFPARPQELFDFFNRQTPQYVSY